MFVGYLLESEEMQRGREHRGDAMRSFHVAQPGRLLSPKYGLWLDFAQARQACCARHKTKSSQAFSHAALLGQGAQGHLRCLRAGGDRCGEPSSHRGSENA